MGIGLLLLRVTLGLTLAAHGAQKLFGWFGGLGPDGTGQALATFGFHPGRPHALEAGFVEVTAGMLLALGLAYGPDALLGLTAAGKGWGAASIGVAVLGAIVQLAQRTRTSGAA